MSGGTWRFTLGAALACVASLGIVVAVVFLARGALQLGSLVHVAVQETSREPESAATTADPAPVVEPRESSPEPQPPAAPTAPISGFTFIRTNPEGYPEFRHDASGIVLVRLPGGPFEMGSSPDEEGHAADEEPVHTVELSPFLVGKYEVTQAQFQQITGRNPSAFQDDENRPVESVTWTELHAESGFLVHTGLSLPSEAQWEYACRAGQPGPYARPGELDETGWYRSDAEPPSSPQAVGGKKPNAFGLHDMHGNVYEWCEDDYDSGFYARPDASGENPLSLAGSDRNLDRKVTRGGAWDRPSAACRSANRARTSPGLSTSFIGFRVVFEP